MVTFAFLSILRHKGQTYMFTKNEKKRKNIDTVMVQIRKKEIREETNNNENCKSC